MKRFLSFLAAFSVVWWIGHPAIAAVMLLIGVGGAPSGGGFLPNTTATFGVTNQILGSKDFNQADGFWVNDIFAGGSNPTVTTVTDTLPDGTSGSVNQVTFPAVANGTTNATLLNQTTTAHSQINNNPVTFGFWAKSISGAGPLWMSITQSLTFVTTPIPLDGTWHLVTSTISPPTPFSNVAPNVQFGVNQFDPTQRGGSATTTIEVTGAFIINGPDAQLVNFTDINTTLATTNLFTTGVLTKPLPAHVRWRDFTKLTPNAGNPVLSESSEPYRTGGLSYPYMTAQMQSGGFYWGFSNCTSQANHEAFLAFCLFKSADGVSNWIEDTTNAPFLKTFGSAADYSTIGTGTPPVAASWQLHPAWLPYGCNVAGTPHNFCIVYGAKDKSTVGQFFLAWSDTVNGVYTPMGCTAGQSSCSTETTVTFANNPLGYSQQAVPGMFNVGGINGTNYIYTSSQGAVVGLWTNVWSTPANPATSTSGNTLSYVSLGLSPVINGADWEYADGSTTFEDNYVFKNHCGFYEYFYTAYNGGNTAPFTHVHQLIGYAISNSPTGPWYKFPGTIIPDTSPMFGGTLYIGDSVAFESGGNFYWSGNYDDGVLNQRAVQASMPQGTCP